MIRKVAIIILNTLPSMAFYIGGSLLHNIEFAIFKKIILFYQKVICKYNYYSKAMNNLEILVSSALSHVCVFELQLYNDPLMQFHHDEILYSITCNLSQNATLLCGIKSKYIYIYTHFFPE